MTQRITSPQFHAAEGIEGWQVLYGRAFAHFATRDFDEGVALVNAIAAVAAAHDHHPDVDLRYQGVTVRIVTHSIRALSERDIALARAISTAARDLGIEQRPAVLRQIDITIDAIARADIMPFWQALLGYDARGEEDLVDPQGIGPAFWFQQMDEPRRDRNRIHIDVAVPHELAEERVAAAIAAGGHLVTDAHAPSWWVLADAERNEACIATWVGRWWEE